MAMTPEVTLPIGGCGRKGEPACPPIECIVVRGGNTYVTINGIEHLLTPTGQPSADDLDAVSTEMDAAVEKTLDGAG